jgi:hypothetical protein
MDSIEQMLERNWHARPPANKLVDWLAEVYLRSHQRLMGGDGLNNPPSKQHDSITLFPEPYGLPGMTGSEYTTLCREEKEIDNGNKGTIRSRLDAS